MEWKTAFSCRYILSYMGFFVTLVVYFCRINLSIAIVAMTDNSTSGEPEFSWSPREKTDLLGCYYYGYILTQVIAAWLASKVGFKMILFVTTFITSILTICSPFLADYGYAWIYASRVFLGFCHGVTFPLLQGSWSVWGPPLERTKLIAIYTAGNSFGTCLIFPIGGFLANSSWGWRSIFYFTGTVGLVWCSFWLLIAYDSPSRHPRISKDEKDYIESSIRKHQESVSLTNSTPWMAILTSPVVWSVATSHLARLVVPGVCVVLAGYAGNNAGLAIALFTIMIGFTAFTVSGCKASMMEFAPNYGGIIYAISNTVSNLSGFLAPLTTGRLLDDNNTISQWQLAFWISAVINIPGLIAFQIFGTDQIQPWAQ